MKKLTDAVRLTFLTFVLAGALVCLCLTSTQTHAQGCGGKLSYVVLDEKGKPMDAEMLKEVDLKVPVGFCGHIREGTLTFRRRQMRLLFRGISTLNNEHFKVELPPFAEGTFAADFTGGCDAGEVSQPRACFISAARWKRVDESASGSQASGVGVVPVSQNPPATNSHLEKGREHATAKRWEDAVSEFKQATRDEPANVAAYDDLGGAYIELRKFNEAEAAYREAVRLKPNNAEAHNGLGRALEKSGRLEESLSPFKEALRLSPDNGKYHRNLGNVYGTLGRSAEAIAELKEAVRLNAKDVDAHTLLGIRCSDKV
ncbi:MAG: tetratricopeptide repeat protein [Pyrinomonadaceae bacterium]